MEREVQCRRQPLRSLPGSAPADYAHNCPWNDWTPPSESRRRFLTASAVSAAAGRACAGARVRVHMCLALDSLEHGEKTMITFASVEVDASGCRALVLRCGSLALTVLPLANITVRPHACCLGMLSISPVNGFKGLLLCLCLKDARRLDAFLALIFSNL